MASSVFDGLASTISNVLGETITITPISGPAYAVVALFRDEPTEINNGDGRTTLAVLPTLSMPKDQLVNLNVGDLVGPINGKIYKVISSITAGSPAADGFLDIELELV